MECKMDNHVVTGLSTQRDAVNSATSSGGLAERGRALENKYFHDRDRELIAAIRKDTAATTTPTTEPTTEPKADPEAGCFDNCHCCANPHSNRLLEELWFEQQNRNAMDNLRGGSKK